MSYSKELTEAILDGVVTEAQAYLINEYDACIACIRKNKRIVELEEENERLREGIEKHKVNRVPEDEQLWALLEQSKSEPIMEDIDVMIRHEYSRNFRTMGE